MEGRGRLLQLLHQYRPIDENDAEQRARIAAFVTSTPECALREHLAGHLTGSAWLVSHDGSNVLLMQHRKLNRWLQLGGHADGDLDLARVAAREATEESGIDGLQLEGSEIFDVDVHAIPARGEVPEHLHYDVRFVVTAPLGAVPRQNEESSAIAWVSIAELEKYSNEESLLRLKRKWLERSSR